MGLYDSGFCTRCQAIITKHVVDRPDVPICTECGWIPSYRILTPEGMGEGISRDCERHDRNHCLGEWSEWPFGREGNVYYQVKCTCECHVGKPTGLSAILDWYKKNPDELTAVKKIMPTFGDAFEDMVDSSE